MKILRPLDPLLLLIRGLSCQPFVFLDY
ncbi:hypothetical protein PCAR4_930020 [Paraburkholderia caribensis]|nr:hypothetical protein PCAR4_930020 [Paraburkholderia caribensis]